MRREMPPIEAERVGSIEDALWFPSAIFRNWQADRESVITGHEGSVSHFEPGNLVPGLKLHEVGGELPRRYCSPGTTIYSPQEWRAHELVTDTVPDFIRALMDKGELVGDIYAVGSLPSHFVCIY